MSDHNILQNKRASSACLNLLVATAIFLAAIPLHSKDKKDPRKSADQEDVIRVSSNLVNFEVMVRDKKGKAITDLKAEDFVLSENGVPQTISFFDSTLPSSGGRTNEPVKP